MSSFGRASLGLIFRAYAHYFILINYGINQTLSIAAQNAGEHNDSFFSKYIREMTTCASF
jgi:hypothetical protein